MHAKWTALLGVLALGGVAAADPPAASDALPVFAYLHGFPPAVLIGAFGGGHGARMRAPRGWFLGADAGWSWLVGNEDGPAPLAIAPARTNAWTFGARGGYQDRSGLAIQARFDELGVDAPDGSGHLAFATAGVRYSVPWPIMPFGEALIGPSLHGSETTFGAVVGVGASVLVARHLSVDLAARDFMTSIDGSIRHLPAVTLGLTAGYVH